MIPSHAGSILKHSMYITVLIVVSMKIKVYHVQATTSYTYDIPLINNMLYCRIFTTEIAANLYCKY